VSRSTQKRLRGRAGVRNALAGSKSTSNDGWCLFLAKAAELVPCSAAASFVYL
jgi:hypothetical protein